MTNKLKNFTLGFTLIELLLVISIISLLSSIVLAGLQTAKGKARDAQRIAEISQLGAALRMYYNDTGKVPGIDGVTFVNSDHPIDSSNGLSNLTDAGGGCESGTDWNTGANVLATKLKNAGYLSTVMKDPLNKTTDTGQYCYRFVPTVHESNGKILGGCIWYISAILTTKPAWARCQPIFWAIYLCPKPTEV